MNDTTLLIGGSGFIGQALARRLAGLGRSVAILSRHRPDELLAGIRWHEGRSDDAALLGRLLPDCRAVVYLASTSTPGDNRRAPFKDAAENLLPLLAFLETLDDYPALPLVYLSSGGAIYGNPAHLPVDEGQRPAPLSQHAAGKAAAELYLGVLAGQGHTVTVLRPANVYGPGQALRAGFGVVRTLLEHVRVNSEMTIWGDGETARDYLYIDDLVDACLAVLDRPAPGTFNLGSGQALSLNALCRVAEAVTGQTLRLRHELDRGCDVRSVALDCSAFMRRYGWHPAVGIEEGVRRTWQWLSELA